MILESTNKVNWSRLGRIFLTSMFFLSVDPMMLQKEATAQVTKKGEKKATFPGNIKLLDNIIQRFEKGEMDGRISLLNKDVSREVVCEFNNGWIKANKVELGEIWTHIDENKINLPEESRQAFDEMFNVNLAIKNELASLSMLLHPLKRATSALMPATKEQLLAHITDYFKPDSSKKKKVETNEGLSCSATFNMFFGILKDEGQLPVVQSASKKFIIGAAKLLKSNLENPSLSNAEKIKAAKLTYTLGILIQKATK